MPTQKEFTITCQFLESGEVAYGDLIETGKSEEDKPPSHPNHKCVDIVISNKTDESIVLFTKRTEPVDIWNFLIDLHPSFAAMIASSDPCNPCDITKKLGGEIKWNGEGLPPIGMEVECRPRSSSSEWIICTALFSPSSIIILCIGGVEESFYIESAEFRLIDQGLKQLYEKFPGQDRGLLESIYDFIDLEIRD